MSDVFELADPRDGEASWPELCRSGKEQSPISLPRCMIDDYINLDDHCDYNLFAHIIQGFPQFEILCSVEFLVFAHTITCNSVKSVYCLYTGVLPPWHLWERSSSMATTQQWRRSPSSMMAETFRCVIIF